MEQVVLAGEAGCISISPFAHELRAHLGTSYIDTEPVLDLFLEAQQYYKQHGIPTKVKSCAFTTTEEMLRTAGVDAMTLPGEQVEELLAMTDSQESLEARSVFINAAKNKAEASTTERLSYINDKTKFMRAYVTNGRGKAKTEDSLAVFCGFQIQAEALVTAADAMPVQEPEVPKAVVDGPGIESQQGQAISVA
ncbi:MAG: hypothetical protein Q9220_002193 [cf. Caloplaca sp. 1 TL-2023]